MPRPLLVLLVLGLVLAGLHLDDLMELSGIENDKESVAGTPYVADGDSLTFGDERVRLLGIDAPELRQDCSNDAGAYPCGRRARDALAELVNGGYVSCRISGRDRYDRGLGWCRRDGVLLNREMVRSGWATADWRFLVEETEARLAGRGIWQGPFQSPRDWRRLHPAR
ncbi:thermonuclease family protein [Rhodobium gokarnense]|uniref:Endonuclease YncB(Thermonuclease family) n=1 Tax=Rhodobium gokarnense TaxID=364296 RepID=A0ABT3HB66_9HYPH|nr:thermonuclease family protein [Rhodobium gokarnense]MCW2307625.1 endonuclease YncB(thermonuclease family) [Rhodobium gokarnense]